MNVRTWLNAAQAGTRRAWRPRRRAVLLIHLTAASDTRISSDGRRDCANDAKGARLRRDGRLCAVAEDQAAALAKSLARGWTVHYATQCGEPGIDETLERIAQSGVEELVVVPMTVPHGGEAGLPALRAVHAFLQRTDRPLDVTIRAAWDDDSGYVAAQAKLLGEFVHGHGLTPSDTFLLMLAPAIPAQAAGARDRSATRAPRAIHLIRRRVGWPWERMSIVRQPAPDAGGCGNSEMERAVEDLVRAGEGRILLCPLGVSSAEAEDFSRFDPRRDADAGNVGVPLYVSPPPATYGPFISALKTLVLRGPRPMTDVRAVQFSLPPNGRSRPCRSAPCIDELMMIGACLPGRLRRGAGPNLRYCDAESLRLVKRPQADVPDLLRAVRQRSGLGEIMLWNTCHRFELYVRAGGQSDASGRKRLSDKLKGILLGAKPGGEPCFNELSGQDAWRHLLRTAVGLNSGLPGERDVLEQLVAGHRLACRAGTAGPFMESVVRAAVAFDTCVRNETSWGRFDGDYVHCAMSRIASAESLDLSRMRCVVFGGSTTSAAVLRTLRQRFNVDDRQLTLFYRGHKHGGQIKLLRRAIGQGRRVRVQSYEEPRILGAVADADVLVFGIDRREPLLDAETVRAVRNGAPGPLAVFDFNVFSSTRGLSALPGVRVFALDRLEAEAAAYADRMCADPLFADAVAQVEAAVAACPFPRDSGAIRPGPDRTPEPQMFWPSVDDAAALSAPARSRDSWPC